MKVFFEGCKGTTFGGESGRNCLKPNLEVFVYEQSGMIKHFFAMNLNYTNTNM